MRKECSRKKQISGKELEPNERQVLIIDIPLFSQRKKSARTSYTAEISSFLHKAYCKTFLTQKKPTSFPQSSSYARRTQKVNIPS